MSKWNVKNEALDQTRLVEDIYKQRGVENYLDLFGLNEKNLNEKLKKH